MTPRTELDWLDLGIEEVPKSEPALGDLGRRPAKSRTTLPESWGSPGGVAAEDLFHLILQIDEQFLERNFSSIASTLGGNRK